MADLLENDNTTNDAVILSDSLGRNFRRIYKTDLYFYPGCTINALDHKISSGEVFISNYKYIVVLIGTNDLAPKEIWKFYKAEKRQGRTGENLPIHTTTPISELSSSFLNLFDTIRNHNNTCQILAVGIPPRPYDNHRNMLHHIDANNELSNICEQKNIIFLKSYILFIKYGNILEDLFADGLHLTSKGSEKLSRLIEGAINCQRSIESKQNH